jgi:hypothetical protein
LKKRNKIIGVIVLMVAILFLTNTHQAVYSIFVSKFSGIDSKYITKEGEWSGEINGMISFYDHTDTLIHDTIFRKAQPIYKIKALNKYFNEITVVDLRNNKSDIFLSTRELLK